MGSIYNIYDIWYTIYYILPSLWKSLWIRTIFCSFLWSHIKRNRCGGFQWGDQETRRPGAGRPGDPETSTGETRRPAAGRPGDSKLSGPRTPFLLLPPRRRLSRSPEELQACSFSVAPRATETTAGGAGRAGSEWRSGKEGPTPPAHAGFDDKTSTTADAPLRGYDDETIFGVLFCSGVLFVFVCFLLNLL